MTRTAKNVPQASAKLAGLRIALKFSARPSATVFCYPNCHDGQCPEGQIVPLTDSAGAIRRRNAVRTSSPGGAVASIQLIMEIAPDDLAALKRAVQLLEHPGLAARLSNMMGKPIELIRHALPTFASDVIATATSKELEVALNVALRTMQRNPHAGSQLLHKAMATASGAAGGAFGLTTLPVELLVSTILS